MMRLLVQLLEMLQKVEIIVSTKTLENHSKLKVLQVPM